MRLRRFNLLKGFIVLFFIITSVDVFAQDAKVGFKIITSKKEPVAFASVQVTDIADSMASQNKITDSLGSVNFNLTSGAQYRVQISSVNFETLTKGIGFPDLIRNLFLRFNLSRGHYRMSWSLLPAHSFARKMIKLSWILKTWQQSPQMLLRS
jgi:hypothetical protein